MHHKYLFVFKALFRPSVRFIRVFFRHLLYLQRYPAIQRLDECAFIGEGSSIQGEFYLGEQSFFQGKASGLVNLGQSVHVHGCILNGPVILGPRVSLASTNIERFTYLAGNSLVIKASIGPFCSIAPGVTIGLPSHPVDGISTSPIFFSNLQQCGINWRDDAVVDELLPVTIGADVWMGANALIKGGVKIGVGAVIGAGAVVTKDVPDFAIVGGVPARIIRYRFEHAVREKILASQWWDQPDLVLRKRIDQWNDPELFIELLRQDIQ